MKKKLVTILSMIIFSIALGYLFFFSLLLGFLGSKYLAGKAVGEQGKVRSLAVPFRRWRIHFHHWFCSVFLIGLSSMTGIHFLTPAITYGLLGGLVFQGIYCYSDWHVILTSRHRVTVGDRFRDAVTLDVGTAVIEARGNLNGSS